MNLVTCSMWFNSKTQGAEAENGLEFEVKLCYEF